MCHQSVLAWIGDHVKASEIAGADVLEVGALDVNGSARGILEAHGPASYTGIDLQAGPGVDHVMDAADLGGDDGPGPVDVVVATEMLEHADQWKAALRGMLSALKPGGLLILTTRSPGFPRHEHPGDHWRFAPETISEIAECADLTVRQLDDDPEAPGVFVKLWRPRKKSWSVPDVAVWDGVHVDPAPPA